MPLPLAIGAGLIVAGTVGNVIAGGQRKRAFNRALNRRRTDVAGFDADRNQALQAFQNSLNPLSAQAAGNKVNALSGLVEAGGQTFDAAQAQGVSDIESGTAEVFGQAPVGGDFAPQSGPGAGVFANMNAQMSPGQNALRDLSAAGLGRLAQGQAEQDVFRDNALANIDVQNQLGGLQQSNALRTADIGLRDLNSNVAFQQATQRAGNKGSSLQAFSGLAQQVGGGLIASDATTPLKKA